MSESSKRKAGVQPLKPSQRLPKQPDSHLRHHQGRRHLDRFRMRKFRPRKAKKIPPKDATLRPTPPLHGLEKENVPVALKTVPPVRPVALRVVIPSMPVTSGSMLRVPRIAALPRPQLHTLVPPGLPLWLCA